MSRADAALLIWRTRDSRTRADRWYLVYLTVMVAVVAVVPLARAVWVSATSPAGIHILSSPGVPDAVALISATLWAGALLLGRERGPALRPPFPTYVLALSDHPRARTFRAPVLRAGVGTVVLTTGAAGLVAAALATSGLTDLATAVRFALAGIMVGIVTVVLWLVGQVFPRAASVLAPAIVVAGIFTAAAPGLLQITPWGWVGLVYPTASLPSHGPALLFLTAALLLAVPPMMNRLEYGRLAAQSARWEKATSYAHGLELGSMASTYQALPRIGRRWSAVEPRGHRAAMFIRRDGIGAIRTPGRLIAGVTGVGVATLLIVSATAPAVPGLIFSVFAGVAMFAAIGPLTDGLRHAASIAADLPLYGLSDAQLMAHHALFPLLVLTVALPVTVIVASMIVGTSVSRPMLSAVVLAISALLLRIGGALKGPLPPAMLAPIPTPVGDLSVVTRAAWAIDGVALAAITGVSVTLLPVAPVFFLTTMASVAVVTFVRWRRRS